MEQTSFDDILSNKEPEKVQVVNEVQVKEVKEAPRETKEEQKVEKPRSYRRGWEEKEQAAQGLVRDPETGQYAAKQEKEEEPKKEIKEEPKQEVKEEPKIEKVEVKEKPAAPQQEFTDKEKAFMRGMEEERRKRQELERRLAAIEAAKVQPGTSEAPKTFWDDPEGALAKQKDEIRAEITNTRLNTAELFSRRDHPDFDEKIAVFAEILQKTPGLHTQWINSANPAEFAYGIGRTHMELQQAGSIDKLREKIEKETRIKLESELKEKAEKLALERAAIPPSLSEAPSKGTNRLVWVGPTPMDTILKP